MPDVAVGQFATVFASAAVDSVLELLPGTHLTPSSGTARHTIDKRVTIKGKDWDPIATPYKYVTGPVGHLSTDFPVIWRGGWSFKADATLVRGISFEGRMTGGAGSLDVDAHNVVFEDCRFTDGFRYIMSVLGSTKKVQNVTFRRCRFREIGNRRAHDHPLYFKTTSAIVIEDCILYDSAGWAFHCYTDCDGLIVRRCVVDDTNGGITFSGDSSNTVLGGYQFSTGNVVEDSIFTNNRGAGSGAWGSSSTTQTLMLAQYYYPGTAGVNTIRNSNFWNPSTPPQGGRIMSGSPIVLQNVLNVDPKYKDPANGDFTLAADSPCLGMGPLSIQPSTPPPPEIPDPATGFTATAEVEQVSLAWTNPTTGYAMDGLILRRSNVSVPTSPADGVEVMRDTTTPYTTTWVDDGLTAGVTYYYALFVTRGMEVSPAVSASATPVAPPPPPPPDDSELHLAVIADLQAAGALIDGAITSLTP